RPWARGPDPKRELMHFIGPERHGAELLEPETDEICCQDDVSHLYRFIRDGLRCPLRIEGNWWDLQVELDAAWINHCEAYQVDQELPLPVGDVESYLEFDHSIYFTSETTLLMRQERLTELRADAINIASWWPQAL